MPVQITSLDQLDEAVVSQLFEEASAMLREQHPEIELTRGPFRDLVLYFSSVFSGVNQANIDLIRQSYSLKAIEANPLLADPELVDHVLSNHLIDRQPGVAAAGEVTIVVSAEVATVIPATSSFTANGRTFQPGAVYVGRPAGSQLGTNDRAMTDLGDGTFSFAVPLIDTDTGASGNIRRGTQMTPLATPENFVRAFASTDFTGGYDTELNAELTAKLRNGIAAKSAGGQSNWEALIKYQPAFARTLNYSIIGFGDPEQHRDQHVIWPGSNGGRVDIYARTALLPVATRLVLTATLIDIVADGSIWQFNIDRDMAPGFYLVERVIPTNGVDDPGYEITEDIRGYDLSRDATTAAFIPDIVNNAEAAYTRYQTAVIKFHDTDKAVSGLTLGDTAEYAVDILAMPLIAELQNFVGGRLARPRACDVLARAANPCFTTISFEVRRANSDPIPNIPEMQAQIANAVNSLGFVGQLHAALISGTAFGFLTGGQSLGRIEMFGRIRAPDGSWLSLRATDILKIPDNPDKSVTGNTTMFILDPADIDISVVAAGYSEN